jgi:hypothetical protein
MHKSGLHKPGALQEGLFLYLRHYSRGLYLPGAFQERDSYNRGITRGGLRIPGHTEELSCTLDTTRGGFLYRGHHVMGCINQGHFIGLHIPWYYKRVYIVTIREGFKYRKRSLPTRGALQREMEWPLN